MAINTGATAGSLQAALQAKAGTITDQSSIEQIMQVQIEMGVLSAGVAAATSANNDLKGQLVSAGRGN